MQRMPLSWALKTIIRASRKLRSAGHDTLHPGWRQRREVMSEQAGLLRAICEHPDDDTHRRVYADWLEDHGEVEQAEYIRTHLKLAKVPEHDALHVRWRRAVRDRNNAGAEARPPLPELPGGL